MILKLYDKFQHWYDKGTVWVFSDPHFNDPESKLMNPDWPDADTIVKNINSKVSKNDTLVLLGDIGDESFVKKLKGYKVLITGNHDRGASNYQRKTWKEDCFVDGVDNRDILKHLPDFNHFSGCESMKHVAFFDNKLFDEVYEGPLFINQKILLSHEPVNTKFGYNIHGHCHQGLKYEYWANDNVLINVCSDVVEFMPQRIDKIIEGYKISTIHRQTINKATTNKGRK